MSSHVRHRLGRTAALLSVVALLVVGCGVPDPAIATPQDNLGLIQTMAQHGLTVLSQTSGDPGCGEPGVVADAVHWRVSVASDPTPRDLYMFRFLDHAAFVAAAAEIDTCQTEFTAAQTRAGGAVTRLDVSPWRAFGDGWSADLTASLTAALKAAAGNGGLKPPGEDQ